MDETILVATCGQGIMWSSDGGDRWRRLDLWQPIEYDAIVRCIAADPMQPSRLLAGYDDGLAVSRDAGVNWTRIDSVLAGQHVWQITFDPKTPSRVYAGTGAPSAARLARSTDGGESWSLLAPEFPEYCRGVHRPRVVTLAVDPVDTHEVWFGVEEGGVFRSRDGGDSWKRVDGPQLAIQNSDAHSIVILEGPPKTHIVVVVDAVHVSHDDGQSWHTMHSAQTLGLRYTRIAQARPASNEVFLAVGDSTPGKTTRLFRSADLGRSWDPVDLPVEANSCAWAFGVHPADPQRLFFGTKFGDLYRSDDAGRSFRKEWRGFSEITDIAWVPVKAEPPPTERYHQGPEPLEPPSR